MYPDFISYASTFNLNQNLCQTCFYEYINCCFFMACSSCHLVNIGVPHFEASAISEKKKSRHYEIMLNDREKQ